LWDDLASPDARTGQRAVAALAADEKTALAVLTRDLRPAVGRQAEAFRRLLDDLGSEEFAIRSRASERLNALGKEAEADVRRALLGELELEVRKRLEDAYYGPNLQRPSSEGLRQARAVQALERLGSPEARRLLRTLADGEADAFLTQEARAALARLRP
jgi:hypothetical protein